MKDHYNTYLRTTGSSMMPFINSGCELIVNMGQNINYKTGDIVCFLKKEGLIAHRIIKGGNKILLKGDNNIKADGAFDKKEIYGKVIFTINSNYIFNNNRNMFLNSLISKISLCMLSNKYLAGNKTTLLSLFYIIFKILNLNTGKKELAVLLNGIKKNETLNLKKITNINTDILTYLALKNKFPKFVFFNKDIWISKNLSQQILNHEKKYIYDQFKKNQIFFISLDNINPNKKIRGSDIDILIRSEDLKKTIRLLKQLNFKIKSQFIHELCFTNKNLLEIDVHILTNFPRPIFFNYQSTKNFTKCFLSSSLKTRAEYFLLYKIIAFWTNDFLNGLFTLKEISNQYTKKINWEIFEYIAKKQNFLGESQLVLCIGENLFPNSYFKKYAPRIPLKIKLISHYFTSSKIGIFGPTTIWGQEKNMHTQQVYLKCFLAHLLVNYKTKLIRLIRIRIIFFVFESIVNLFYWKIKKLQKKLYKLILSIKNIK